MTKVVIIDDEIRGAMSLQKMLQFTHADIEVATLAHSGAEGIEAIKEHEPDLVFLDIHMPDMSGFDMLEKIGEINFDIIFTTAHDEYAIKAFRYAAVDYLLKPIDMDELKEAIEKQKKTNVLPLYESTETNDKNSADNSRPTVLSKIALPTLEGLVFIKIEDIIRLQSTGNYTTFYNVNKSKIIVSKSLGDFEELLETHGFYRVHNSHMINIAHVERYIKGEGGSVIMSDKSEVEVSRRKKEDFIEHLEKVVVKKR